MNQQELEPFAREAAENIKTEKDLNSFSQLMTKIAVKTALNVELDEYLGYEKYQESSHSNSRNSG